MAYTTIDNPELFFQTKLYTGNGGTLAVTLDGSENMQPDFVWLKDRDGTNGHFLYDSARTATKELNSETVQAEQTKSGGLTAFDSNGFTLGDYSGTNGNTVNHVAWNWKAGTSFTNDASSTSIGDIDSAGRVSTDAGISLCTWTGNGSNSQTVKHGLSTAPELIILKARGQGTYGWVTYDAINGAGKYLTLNNTHGAVSDTGMWSNTAPTSSVFSLSNGGNTVATNPNTITMMAWCFHSVKGYSKIGSYTGNGNADGSYIHLGFRPAWVMVKRTDSADYWYMFDNKRDVDNVIEGKLEANTADAEYTSVDWLDFTASGFKWRYTGGGVNASGGSFIYMAFAESPFVNSKGVPNNAR